MCWPFPGSSAVRWISDEELSADYIIPAAFDVRVKDAVAEAVKAAAYKTGVARI